MTPQKTSLRSDEQSLTPKTASSSLPNVQTLSSMGSSNIPDNDAMYLQWIRNFANVAGSEASELGLTPAQVAELSALAATFSEAYLESQRYKILARAKVANKEHARHSSEEVFRNFAKLISNNFAVSDGLKVRLGMNANPAPPSPVQTPDQLIVVCQPNGINQLKWKPNGNSRTVTYIIESCPSGSRDWRMVGITSTLKFKHKVHEFGEALYYRVSAKRSKTQSVPCAPVVASAYLRNHLSDAKQVA